MADQMIGWRTQMLGIQLEGEKHLGFSGAYHPNELWTDPEMIGACLLTSEDDQIVREAGFRQPLVGYGARPLGANAGMIRPDTAKRPTKRPRIGTPYARCRDHLLHYTGCHCGV